MKEKDDRNVNNLNNNAQDLSQDLWQRRFEKVQYDLGTVDLSDLWSSLDVIDKLKSSGQLNVGDKKIKLDLVKLLFNHNQNNQRDYRFRQSKIHEYYISCDDYRRYAIEKDYLQYHLGVDLYQLGKLSAKEQVLVFDSAFCAMMITNFYALVFRQDLLSRLGQGNFDLKDSYNQHSHRVEVNLTLM